MDEPRYLLICNTADGLIAQVNGVIVQLQLARRMGLIPIVHLHRRSNMFGGINPYYDPAQGENVWNYYFRPIGPDRAELDRMIAQGRVLTLATAAELMRLFRWDPDSHYMNPYGWFRSVANMADGPYPAAWWNRQRDRARTFLDDGTVALLPALADRVDAFAAARFGGHTLGLQLRGSDKFDFGAGPNLSRKVEPREYFPHIDRYLAENPDCTRIFVATDQRQWLKALAARYPDHVIGYSDISLSDSNDNMFNAGDRKAARGFEVLVDMMLLTRCRFLIKCHAAVGEMALTMNSGLGFVDLNYETQPARARARAARMVAAPLIRLLATAWKRRTEGGAGLVEVVALEGDDVIVDPRDPRALNTRAEDSPTRALRGGTGRRRIGDALAFALERLGAACYRYDRP